MKLEGEKGAGGSGPLRWEGEEGTEGGGMTLRRRADRRVSRIDRAYRPAGTLDKILESSVTSRAVCRRSSSVGKIRASRMRSVAAKAAQTSVE